MGNAFSWRTWNKDGRTSIQHNQYATNSAFPSLLNFLLSGNLIPFHSTQWCFPVLYTTWKSKLQSAFCLEEPHFALYNIQLQVLCCM